MAPRRSLTRPVYYRFAYSPVSGVVTLGHNLESEPAFVRYFEEMRAERSEPDLILGYAYRSRDGNAWSFFTPEHEAILDPEIARAVTEAIREAEPSLGVGEGDPTQASEGDS